MIETKTAVTKREAWATLSEEERTAAPALPLPYVRANFRPETVEFSAARGEDEDGPIRWWVVVRGTRILTSGFLGRAAGTCVFSFSKAGSVEELPEWLRPWVRHQISAFAVTTGAGA